MIRLEAFALWAAVAMYAVATALFGAAAVFRGDRMRRAGTFTAVAGVLAHAVAIAARWVATGHGPVMGPYENALAGAFFLPVIFGVIAWRFPTARRAAPLVLAAALLMLGNGITERSRLSPLEPPYRSNWLVVHVVFAWLAFGSYVVASAISGYYLWITRRLSAARAGEGAAADRPAVIDELAAKLIAFGFAADSVMIASGAVWAHGLWGRYWAWDPIETWSLVAWLVYGVNLHLRFTLGWKGRRAAWVAMLSVVLIVITFFGVGVISEVHTELL